MKQKLTDKEKKELKKLLDDQDLPEDSSWLLVDQYAKAKSRFVCILCEKTHLIKNCPNKNKTKDKGDSEHVDSYSYNSQYYSGDYHE